LVALPLVAAIVNLTACDMIVGLLDPMFPSDAEEFSPPPVYSTWWDMTRACSGSNRSLGDVAWFKTSQPLHNFRTGEALGGYWNSFDNRIVLTTAVMHDGSIVRHEMLHALLRKDGHPRNQFLGKCLGTVACQGACIADAGPYPQPLQTPIHVTGDSIDITLAVDPRNPSPAQDDGFFSITVFVRNRSTHWVTVPNYYSQFFPGIDSAHTFQFDVVGPNGGLSSGEVRFDPSEWVFAPGEIKRQVFDFSMGGEGPFAHEFPAGAYIARGGYSGYMSGDSSFVISP